MNNKQVAGILRKRYGRFYTPPMTDTDYLKLYRGTLTLAEIKLGLAWQELKRALTSWFRGFFCEPINSLNQFYNAQSHHYRIEFYSVLSRRWERKLHHWNEECIDRYIYLGYLRKVKI